MRITNRSPFRPRGEIQNYKIENKAKSKEATVYIYDEISWFGIEAGQFVKDFAKIDAETIHLRINSPGGSVFDGTAIFNTIKQHKAKTITHIDGLAASIASVIALAADEVRMASNAFFMAHDPWSIVIGNAETMREEADLLEKVGGTISDTYMKKTGKDEKEILAIMASETWLTAEEALEMGFIDAIDGDEKDEKARADLFDLSVFANVPDQLKGEKQKLPTARELEKTLKSSGFSNKQAKEILASGFQDGQRDVDTSEEPPKLPDTQRDVVDIAQRDVEELDKDKKDKTADILTRAEMLAPTK